MPDEIIIPGGHDEWAGHSWGDFVIGAEHTVFEWCMIYTDRHPTAFLGNHYRTATAELQDARLTLLGARGSNEPGMRPHPTEPCKGVWDDQAIYRVCNAVFQELADGIRRDRLAAKRVYLDDLPGELDPTLCVLDAPLVLAIARRRDDYGQYIAQLLTADEGTKKTERPKQQRETKIAVVRRYLESEYPNGIIPAEATDKVIARVTDASERTVRRARKK
jgi:hypothetical protein